MTSKLSEEQLRLLSDETDKAMDEIQQSIEQADKMLLTLEKQGMSDSPTAIKIRDLVTSMREQRKKLLNTVSCDKKVTFADHLKSRAEAGDGLAEQASLGLQSGMNPLDIAAGEAGSLRSEDTLPPIENEIEQAEKMLISLKAQGLENSPTANKIRNLVESMKQHVKQVPSLNAVTPHLKPIIKSPSPIHQFSDSDAEEYLPQSTSKAKHVAFKDDMLNIAKGREALEQKSAAAAAAAQNSGDADLLEAENMTSDIFGMLNSFMKETDEVSSKSGSNPSKRLEQLEALEGQLSGIKDMISEAKTKASQDLEKSKNKAKLLNGLDPRDIDLSENLQFLKLTHTVESMRLHSTTQYDRLKDVVAILNNHAERITSIEDTVHEIKHEFSTSINALKRTSLNSMSEKLLENLIKQHENRPHFVLELFETASKIKTDEKRQLALEVLKNLSNYQPKNMKVVNDTKAIAAGEMLSGIIKAGETHSNDSPKTIPSLSQLAENSIKNSEETDLPASNDNSPLNSTQADPGTKKALSFLAGLSNGEGVNLENLTAATINHVDAGQNTTESSDESTTDTEDRGQTSNAEYSDMHTNEIQDLRRIDESKTDMVTKMLGAAQLGVNIEQAQEEVKQLVTDLLPTLTRNYRNKYLSNEVISEAKQEIANYILNNSEAFSSDTNKVYWEFYGIFEIGILKVLWGLFLKI